MFRVCISIKICRRYFNRSRYSSYCFGENPDVEWKERMASSSTKTSIYVSSRTSSESFPISSFAITSTFVLKAAMLTGMKDSNNNTDRIHDLILPLPLLIIIPIPSVTREPACRQVLKSGVQDLIPSLDPRQKHSGMTDIVCT